MYKYKISTLFIYFYFLITFNVVGMRESAEFANELLRALRGRRDWKRGITKNELHNYWCCVTDPWLDSRIDLFFNM